MELGYPNTTKEFKEAFKSNFDCVEYLFKILYPEGFICKRCNSKKYWLVSDKVYRCKNCKHEMSPMSNTLFHSTNLPLSDLFRIAWSIVNNDRMEARDIEERLHVSASSAWKWLLKLKSILSTQEKFNNSIEIDTVIFEGKTKKKSEKKETLIIVIAVESETGRISLKLINEESRKNINLFIKNNIESGSIIKTKVKKCYTDITKMKYVHEADNLIDDYLPKVKNVIALHKLWFEKKQVRFLNKDHLQTCLNEFVFKHNSAELNKGEKFHRIIENVIKNEPLLCYVSKI